MFPEYSAQKVVVLIWTCRTSKILMVCFKKSSGTKPLLHNSVMTWRHEVSIDHRTFLTFELLRFDRAMHPVYKLLEENRLLPSSRQALGTEETHNSQQLLSPCYVLKLLAFQFNNVESTFRAFPCSIYPRRVLIKFLFRVVGVGKGEFFVPSPALCVALNAIQMPESARASSPRSKVRNCHVLLVPPGRTT